MPHDFTESSKSKDPIISEDDYAHHRAATLLNSGSLSLATSTAGSPTNAASRSRSPIVGAQNDSISKKLDGSLRPASSSRSSAHGYRESSFPNACPSVPPEEESSSKERDAAAAAVGMLAISDDLSSNLEKTNGENAGLPSGVRNAGSPSPPSGRGSGADREPVRRTSASLKAWAVDDQDNVNSLVSNVIAGTSQLVSDSHTSATGVGVPGRRGPSAGGDRADARSPLELSLIHI